MATQALTTEPAEHEITPAWDDALQQFANRLPHPEYAGTAPVPGRRLKQLLPDLRTVAGETLDSCKLYYVASPADQAEHLDNLRALFRQGGKAAIVPYLQPYEAFLGQPNAQAAQ